MQSSRTESQCLCFPFLPHTPSSNLAFHLYTLSLPFPRGEVNIGAFQLLVCWALCFLVRSHKVRAETANIKTAYNLLSHTFQCELWTIYAIVIYSSISHHMWETDCGTDQWSWKIIPAHHRVETQVAALLTLQISCLQCTIFKMTHSHTKKTPLPVVLWGQFHKVKVNFFTWPSEGFTICKQVWSLDKDKLFIEEFWRI